MLASKDGHSVVVKLLLDNGAQSVPSTSYGKLAEIEF